MNFSSILEVDSIILKEIANIISTETIINSLLYSKTEIKKKLLQVFSSEKAKNILYENIEILEKSAVIDFEEILSAQNQVLFFVELYKSIFDNKLGISHFSLLSFFDEASLKIVLNNISKDELEVGFLFSPIRLKEKLKKLGFEIDEYNLNNKDIEKIILAKKKIIKCANILIEKKELSIKFFLGYFYFPKIFSILNSTDIEFLLKEYSSEILVLIARENLLNEFLILFKEKNILKKIQKDFINQYKKVNKYLKKIRANDVFNNIVEPSLYTLESKFNKIIYNLLLENKIFKNELFFN